MAFDPKAFLAEPSGFDPQAFLGVPAFLRERGQRQSDGTYLVDTPQGPVRFDAQGNEIQSPEEAAARKSIGEESTKEAVLTRALATTQGGAQGFVPQVAGLSKASGTNVDELAESYRTERDQAARAVKQATEKSGLAFPIAGAILSSGPAAPETIAGRVALSTGMGAANALAESSADLTKGQLAPALKDTATGAGVGLLAAGAGEVVGAGLRKGISALTGNTADAIATQTAKDVAAVEGEIASLRGKLGGETQKASRFIENIQRGTEGVERLGPEAQELAEQILAKSEAGLPGQLATIEGIERDLAARTASAADDAARATRDYFAAPLWTTEILPRLRSTIAPRFGLAAMGAVVGGAADIFTGGDGRFGGFAGSVIGAPGMLQMMRNISKSPRVQVAISQKLAPLLQGIGNAVARGLAPTAATLGGLVVDESVLGPPDLAAEQLIAEGGLKSVLGVNKPIPAPELDAAQGPADLPIKQTMGVMLLGGALEDHNATTGKAVKKMLKGGEKPPKYEPRQLPKDFESLLTPEAMLERVTANTGNLSEVAPLVSAQMVATAQRAVSYLSSVAATPAPKGPLAAPWERSAAERRALSLAVETVESPLSVLEYAAAGMLAPEQVAALNAVYPALGRTLADKALAQLAESPSMPYSQRIMVGFLAGVDPDGSLSQTASNQAAISADVQKPSMQQSKGESNLTLAQRMDPHETRDT